MQGDLQTPGDLADADTGQSADEEPPTARAYDDPLEHVLDCLRRLDWVLRREVGQRSPRAATDYLSFAAITETEVGCLLADADAANANAAARGRDDRAQQEIHRLEREIEQRAAASTARGERLPLYDLGRIFGLGKYELDIVVACLAPEVDRKYERIYGYLQDDMGRKLPSVGLLLALFERQSIGRLAVRASVFNPLAPLLRYQLLHVTDDDGSQPFAARSLRLDERIVSFLLGIALADSRIADCLVPAAPARNRRALSDSECVARDVLANAIGASLKEDGARRKPLLYLHGSGAVTAGDLVHEVAAGVGLPVIQVDAQQLAAGSAGFAGGVFLVLRECLLQQTVAFFCGVDRVFEPDRSGLQQAALFRLVADLGGITFLSGAGPWSWAPPPASLSLLPVELRPAAYSEQIDIWRRLAHESERLSDAQLLEVASKHPMAPADIAAAMQLARSYATLRGAATLTLDDVIQACRSRSQTNLTGVARRIEPKYDWEDIVLPAAQVAQLGAICNHAKRRSVVYGEWGFEGTLSLGKGLNALFAGPPGTGKTMAAEVIARDLHLDLYKIDLSQVISKYIGETEKNLRQIFDQAAAGHAILLFDEADALLGKRSAVKDAHDRYANTEIAYLLQKMEEYEGITILTTNLRQNMDEAFIRRMRFVVEFPFPDEAARRGIWQRVWPVQMPLAAEIDADFLARRFKLSGGSIRNIALSAAFAAAEQATAVDMPLLLGAVRQELRKIGRLVDDVEYQGEPAAGRTLSA